MIKKERKEIILGRIYSGVWFGFVALLAWALPIAYMSIIGHLSYAVTTVAFYISIAIYVLYAVLDLRKVYLGKEEEGYIDL